MANPVKTPNVEYPREEFQHLYTKEKEKKRKTKTNPNFADPKKQFQFVHNEVGMDGNRSKKELSKFL